MSTRVPAPEIQPSNTARIGVVGLLCCTLLAWEALRNHSSSGTRRPPAFAAGRTPLQLVGGGDASSTHEDASRTSAAATTTDVSTSSAPASQIGGTSPSVTPQTAETASTVLKVPNKTTQAIPATTKTVSTVAKASNGNTHILSSEELGIRTSRYDEENGNVTFTNKDCGQPPQPKSSPLDNAHDFRNNLLYIDPMDPIFAAANGKSFEQLSQTFFLETQNAVATGTLADVCGSSIWERHIGRIGLNGMFDVFMFRTFTTTGGTTNVGMHHALHSLGVWAAEYARGQDIKVRHVMRIFASRWVDGPSMRREAAIHGAIWSAVSTLGSMGSSRTDLWLFFRREISYAVDDQRFAALYISCLHGFGHAVGVLSSTTVTPSSSFKCLEYPSLDLPSSKWQQAEDMALNICDAARLAGYSEDIFSSASSSSSSSSPSSLSPSEEGEDSNRTLAPRSNTRRAQEAYICAGGVYMHMFSHSNVKMKTPKSRSPTNTDIKIDWWTPCGRIERYAAPCFVFLFRWEIAQDRLMHASGMAMEENFLFPTSCHRSAARIMQYSQKYNPTSISSASDSVMLACIFGLSGYLFQNAVFHSPAFFLSDGCHGGLDSSLKDKLALRSAANDSAQPWRQLFLLSSSSPRPSSPANSPMPMLPKEPLFSFCCKVATGTGFDKAAVVKRITAWRADKRKKQQQTSKKPAIRPQNPQNPPKMDATSPPTGAPPAGNPGSLGPPNNAPGTGGSNEENNDEDDDEDELIRPGFAWATDRPNANWAAREATVASIASTLVAKPSLWHSHDSLNGRFKACIAGAAAGQSPDVVNMSTPAWAVRWSLCEDAIPRGAPRDSADAIGLVNLCLRNVYSRSQLSMDRTVVWDMDALRL
jgi:hypothetical protein